MTIINVDYKDCALEIKVNGCFVQKPCITADNPFDYYGYVEYDFDLLNITAMAYDEDGNELTSVTIDYDLTGITEKEFQDMLWNKHGIDLVIDFNKIHTAVEKYVEENGL